MKKRKLMKKLNETAKSAGAELVWVREGGNHEVWSISGQRIIVPRHSEINERTAEGILKTAKEAVK